MGILFDRYARSGGAPERAMVRSADDRWVSWSRAKAACEDTQPLSATEISKVQTVLTANADSRDVVGAPANASAFEQAQQGVNARGFDNVVRVRGKSEGILHTRVSASDKETQRPPRGAGGRELWGSARASVLALQGPSD